MSTTTILDYWEPGDEPTMVLRYFYLDAEAQLAALHLRQEWLLPLVPMHLTVTLHLLL